MLNQNKKKLTKEEKMKRRKEKIKEVKKEIKEEFKFNVPNMITLSRLGLIFIIVYMLFSGFSRLTIAILFAIAALTDALDGYAARKLKQTSYIGARLDQVIDRIFIVTIIFALALWAVENKIPDKNFILMLFLVSSREIIGSFGVIIRTIRGKDLHEVLYVGKITCWFQGVALFLIIAGVSFAIYPAIATCIIGIISGFDYLKRSFM